MIYHVSQQVVVVALSMRGGGAAQANDLLQFVGQTATIEQGRSTPAGEAYVLRFDDGQLRVLFESELRLKDRQIRVQSRRAAELKADDQLLLVLDRDDFPSPLAVDDVQDRDGETVAVSLHHLVAQDFEDEPFSITIYFQRDEQVTVVQK